MPESPVVYHGTFAGFENFDKKFMGSFTGAPSAHEGFFFASNKKVAISYASDLTRQLREHAEKAELARKEIERITGDSYFTALHKAYLQKYSADTINKIYELNELISRYEDLEAGVESVPMGYDYELDPSGRLIKARLYFKNSLIYDMQGKEYRTVSYIDLIKKAKSEGHDGLIIKNTYDGANPVGNLIMTDIYVAFEVSQIKIINNRRDNHMIREDVAPAAPDVTGLVNRILQEVKAKPWTVPQMRSEIVARLKQASDEIDRKIITEIQSFRPLGVMSEFAEVMMGAGATRPKKGEPISTPFGTIVFNEKRVPANVRIARWNAEHTEAEEIRKIIPEYAFALEARPNTTTGNYRVVEHAQRLKAQGLLTPEEGKILEALERYWQSHPELDRQKGYGVWAYDLELMVPERLKAKTASVSESVTSKQPWEMSYSEFANFFEDVWGGNHFVFAERVGKPLGILSQAGVPYHMILGRKIGYSGSMYRDVWRLAIVDKALSEGKKVPEEVLADLSEALKHEKGKYETIRKELEEKRIREEGGTGMVEQEKPPSQEVKDWMKRALNIEDYKGGRHDRIQMLALLIQNSELGNIRSIHDAGSMALALGKDLGYGTPPPYGKSLERYYGEKIAAETGREVPIIKSSDIIKPPSKEPLKSAEELYKIYTSGYSGISFLGIVRQDTKELADSILFDLRHMNLNPETYTKDILMSYAAKFKEWAQRDYEKEHEKIVARQQKEAAEKEKERIEGGQAFWDEVKNLKVVDYEVEHDVNPDYPTRTYYHVYDRTFAVLENGKRVQVSYVINKGEYGKRALKATKAYYAQFYNQYMGKPLSEWITYEDLIRGNRYEDYVKQKLKSVQMRFEVGERITGAASRNTYRYYYRNRPPGIGTQPAGMITYESWLPARTTPHGRMAFGWVEYDRPLSTEEITGYELFEDEVELPRPVKELVQFAKTEGIDEAMKEVTSEYGRAVWEWLKSQKRIRAGMGQKEQIRMEIMRLAGITELSVREPQREPQKASLEDLVNEYKKTGEEMKRRGITRRAGPTADVLMTQENKLWDAIRDIYLKMLEQIPESSQIIPEGLGVLALAGRATTKAVQESPSRVNLKEMISELLRGQQVIASIQSAKTIEELQPILEGIKFLPLPEDYKKSILVRYQQKHSELMAERPFGVPVKTEEEKPKVIGAPTPQQRFEAELRKKAAEKRGARGQPTLTGTVSTSRRLEEFGIKERMTQGYREGDEVQDYRGVKGRIMYLSPALFPGATYARILWEGGLQKTYTISEFNRTVKGLVKEQTQPYGVREAKGYTQRQRYTIRKDGRVFANENDPVEAENIYQMLKRTYSKSAIDLLENLTHPMVHTRVLKEYNPMFGETVVAAPGAVREPARYAGYSGYYSRTAAGGY